MKKIKLTGKLSLNKMKVSELNNQNSIIGGKTVLTCVETAGTCHTDADGCHSSPVCCISYTCPTYDILCPSIPHPIDDKID